jgi:hypothetical protein
VLAIINLAVSTEPTTTETSKKICCRPRFFPNQIHVVFAAFIVILNINFLPQTYTIRTTANKNKSRCR